MTVERKREKANRCPFPLCNKINTKNCKQNKRNERKRAECVKYYSIIKGTIERSRENMLYLNPRWHQRIITLEKKIEISFIIHSKS